jgi:hypothetical protein
MVGGSAPSRGARLGDLVLDVSETNRWHYNTENSMLSKSKPLQNFNICSSGLKLAKRELGFGKIISQTNFPISREYFARNDKPIL